MAAVTVLNRSSPPPRLDTIAATWGGLIAGIGLIVAGPRELGLRIAIVVVVGVVAGFLTGMRAIRHRFLNAAAAWLVANVFYVAFVAAAAIVHLLTGPHAPPLDPGGIRRWAAVTAISLLATLVGGGIANTMLRPAARRSNYS